MHKQTLVFGLLLGGTSVVVYACGGQETPKAVTPVASASSSAPVASVTETAPPIASASTPPAPPVAAPSVIVTDLKSAERLSVHGTDLYWADRKLASVFTAPTSGGPAKAIAEGQKGIAELTADNDAVYWTTSDGKGGGNVMKVLRKGGKPTKLATIAPGDLGGPIGIEVDATSVYVAVSTGVGSVVKVGKNGGGVVTLASKQRSPYDLSVDASNVYWTVFGAGTSDGAIMSVPLKGGTAIAIAEKQKLPWWIASDGKEVFWIVKGPPGAVMKAPVAGGTPTALVKDVKAGSCLVVEDAWVYYASEDDDYVKKVKKEGGEPVSLAEKQKSPMGLAVDATSIYWISKVDGTILKLAKLP